MIKKNLTRGLQFACGVAVVAAAVGATIHTNDTKAAATTPSGVCGLLMTKSGYGFQGKSCSPSDTSCQNDTATLLGTVNFNGGPNSVNLSVQEVMNAGQGNAYTVRDTVSFNNITVNPTPLASGAYQVTFGDTSSDDSFLFLPTNNNNTYLVTSYKQQTSAQGSAPWTGVCQVQ